ncbi:receptor-like protein 7 [Ziziphus jujuba]|uniref:Receptor-like protein 7 n=1 Tax=Ziziphus jujuba TaxID=326968 RepID=A0A6P3ZDS2_ZIZJJ|nr:receptor-like protein 7 [Ziziphus jujuba]
MSILGLSLRLIVFYRLLIRLLLFTVFVSNYISFASEQQPFCHDEERLALLQFKDSFVINKSTSSFEGAYPKVLQWNSGSNCCLWDGIDCDEETGHVIGLDLGSSCLFGSINSSSTLFTLVHLQMLSVADNHFNFSQIPAAIGQLSSLTFLNLSSSAFYGQVPLEISNLSKLSSLDMSSNYDPDTGEKFLLLRNPNLKTLVQNLSGLEILILSYVDISSDIPDLLTNFTSLTTLHLRECELYGDFPPELFQLPNLQSLIVQFNENLTGRLPEFRQRSPLTTLRLRGTKFFGSLPYSIEKLDSLDMLDVKYCNFSGPIPFSLGKLTHLTYLNLKGNNFSGDIPSSLRNLTHLTTLSIGENQITGPIPLWLGNLTKLSKLSLQDNLLHGTVPQSLSMLVNLEKLNIRYNNLGGNLKFDMFFNMKNLTHLRLGHNNLSLIFGEENRNATVSKFKVLHLGSCNLRKFPNFLRHQNELELLTLGGNKISGKIPNWMWNTSKNTLMKLHVSNNFLTGFDQIPAVLPWVNLGLFDISSNMLQVELPIPPPSIARYDVSNNMLTGEIPPVFCNMSSLHILDLSDNNLGGIIPQCLGNSSSSLSVLNLRNNSFHGIIPPLCSSNNASQLKMIDVSYNQFQGKLPRSLSNCLMLEAIVVSNNQLHGSFPSWLGSLPDLKLLILHRNGFYGSIEKPKQDFYFSNLQVLDLSSNNFTGELPSQYIFHWNALNSIKSNANGLTYMGANMYYSTNSTTGYDTTIEERYRITIMSKGVATYFDSIQDVFAFIDLSDNIFEGEISDLFGNLKALHSLNFSNNMLTGCIPSSLWNLSELESLDLSRNNLSCHIPQELTQLGFLSSFNVSHNNLTGPIPQGKQFNAFDSSSYDGNPELCGDPLPKKCGNSQSPPSPFEDYRKDSKSILKKDWMFILAGYISGLVVGVVLADIAMEKTPGWFHWFVDVLSEWRKPRRGRRT